jgi:hypothetical protein
MTVQVAASTLCNRFHIVPYLIVPEESGGEAMSRISQLKLASPIARIAFLLFAVSAADAQGLPSGCATAATDHNPTLAHWMFQNGCSYGVYWTVQCGVGATMCFGAGRVNVAAGGTETRNMPPGSWEIDGPFRQ